MIFRTDRLKLIDNKITHKPICLTAKLLSKTVKKVFIFLYSYTYLLLCT